MSDNRIEIEVTATDSASSIIVGASSKISDCFKSLQAAQNDLSGAINESIAPLNAAEQAQMASADSSLKLRDAQVQVRAKQDELNSTIKQYGSSSQEAASKLRELNSSQAELAKIQPQVVESAKQQSISYKDLVVGVSGVATASFALYNAYDNINDKAVSVSRANLGVKTSADAVEGAQKKYNDTVSKYGPVSAEAIAASKDLQLAQERNSVAVERADMVQGDYSKTIVTSALSVIPTMITMVSSLSTVKGILTGVTNAGTVAENAGTIAKSLAIPPTLSLTGVMAGLNTIMEKNPVIFVVAGIIALVAALVAAYTYCKPFKDAVDAVGKALGDALKPAIDAVGGALTWLWTNVLRPLAEFLFGGFIAAINAVGGAISTIANAVGGAWNWICESVGKATGTWNGIVIKGMEEQLKAVDEGMQEQLEVVKAATQQQILDENTAYDTRTKEAQKFWNDFINPPKNAWDEIATAINGKYDDQLSSLNDWASSERDAINKHYDEEVQNVNDYYKKQIDDTNRYYDSLIDVTQKALDDLRIGRQTDLDYLEAEYLRRKIAIEGEPDTVLDAASKTLKILQDARAEETSELDGKYSDQVAATNKFYDELETATNAGLNALRVARDADFDTLELGMLQKKEALEASFKAGLINEKTYQDQLSELSKTYNASRSAMSDDYRLAELLAEKEASNASAKIATEREIALAAISTAEQEQRKAIAATYDAQELEQQKILADKSAAGLLTKEERLKQLTDKYGEIRNTMTEGYRLKELDADKLNTENVATVNKQRNTTVEGLVNDQNIEVEKINKERKLATVTLELEVNNMMEYLNKQRNNDVVKLRAEQRTIETNHYNAVNDIVRREEATRTAILAAAERDRAAIIASANSQLTPGATAYAPLPAVSTVTAVSSSPLGIGGLTLTSFSGPQELAAELMVRANRDYAVAVGYARQIGDNEGWNETQMQAFLQMIPRAAEGGIFTKPTLALIGEAGPERVIPLNKFNSGVEAPESKTLLFNTTINLTVAPGTVQNPKQMARELLDEMNSIIRNDMKSKTFFTQG